MSAHVNTQIQLPITDPFYLIQLGFSIPRYFSTLYEVTVDSKLYVSDRNITVGKITFSANGSVSTSVAIKNADNWASILVLDESPAGKTARIYKAYSKTPTSLDLIMLFDGVMDKTSINESQVVVSLLSKGHEQISPGLVIGRPYFNHLPPAGTIITSGNTTITLDAANG